MSGQKHAAVLPTEGRPWEEIRRSLLDAKRCDYNWREGRLPLYVYYNDEALLKVSREAFNLYFSENALGRKAFPSLVQLEADIVSMALRLFNAGDEAGGTFTSGGTESQLLAVKAARNRALTERPELARPSIVVPRSCHPSIDKAAHYLGLEVRRVPISDAFRADPAAIAEAIDDSTIMLVASAPGYTHGVFDPVAEFGAIAEARGLWLHVDACLGGFLAPFARMEGYPIPDFDFSVPGVTSLAADIHKYGFSAKGASVLLLRSETLRRFQQFEHRDWPRGVYATDTFLGSRPGGPAASAWAVMNYLGEAGYRRIARRIMSAKQGLMGGIESIPGLEVIRPSELSMLLYRSRDAALDTNALAEGMGARGWFMGRSLEPEAIHFAINPVHAPVIDRYLADLRAVSLEVRESGRVGALDKSTY
ncbi:MAG TPA: aspartate aminotransferase family protein [Kiloniellaceae bacterium]